MCTKRHEGKFYIAIKDTGVGTEPEHLPEDGKVYEGIANVRSRLENMCGGQLEIESKIDQGTKVWIVLPEY